MSEIAIMRSGLRISIAAPSPNMVNPRDLAEHLSKLCAHNGATYSFYSEAQHACIVAAELALLEGPLPALYGLLHNADLAVCPGLLPMDRSKVMRAIHEAFDLDWPIPIGIHIPLNKVHERVTLTEMRDLLAGRDDEIARMRSMGIQPLSKTIRPMAWDKATDKFLAELQIYTTMAGLPPIALRGLA
jgi:hypothetical protein